jgi:thymidylate synthase (FAD)
MESQVTPAKKITTFSLNKLNLEHAIDPLGDGISSLALVRVSGSDVDVANAARVSFGKFVTELSEHDIKLIRYLVQHNHSSPFEHNQLSFRVKCPLFVARQWMRHRMNSYNEISYRYVKSALEFYVPAKWRYQDTQNRQGSVGEFEDTAMKEKYMAALTTATKTYEELLASGLCRELARGLLPMCTYTEFIYTCNLHSLIHFLKLRLEPGAQWEIRMFAQGLLELALPHFPVSLGAWKEFHMPQLAIEQMANIQATHQNQHK